MKSNFRKGFTLIELVIVICIIGVLASILVPSAMGYIRKANRSTDIGTARTIRSDVSIIITDDGDFANSYAGNCSTKRNVTVIHTGDSESYTVCVVARKEANTHDKWKALDADAADFVKELNSMEQSKIALKFKKLANGDELDSWLICRRSGDPTSIEVWAGDSGNNPLYRVWPETEDRYK